MKSPGMTATGFYLLPYSIEQIEPFLFTPRFYSFKSIRTAAAGSFLGYQKANRTYGMTLWTWNTLNSMESNKIEIFGDVKHGAVFEV